MIDTLILLALVIMGLFLFGIVFHKHWASKILAILFLIIALFSLFVALYSFSGSGAVGWENLISFYAFIIFIVTSFFSFLCFRLDRQWARIVLAVLFLAIALILIFLSAEVYEWWCLIDGSCSPDYLYLPVFFVLSLGMSLACFKRWPNKNEILQ